MHLLRLLPKPALFAASYYSLPLLTGITRHQTRHIAAKLCSLLLLTLLVALPSTALAAAASQHPNPARQTTPQLGSGKPATALEKDIIIVKPNGQQLLTGLTATISAGTVIASGDVVSNYLEPQALLDSSGKKLMLVCKQPEFRLETAALDELLQKGITLNLPLRKTQKQQAGLDLRPLEKLLGFTLAEPADGKTLEIRLKQQNEPNSRQLNTVRPKTAINNKIILAWDYISENAAANIPPQINDGLNVLSPTWFAVIDENGQVRNNADNSYVNAAHAHGCQVWPLITNSFDRDLTRQVLTNAAASDNIIRQLAVYSALYNLDGINIDFENIYDEDKDLFTAFIAKLTNALHQQNITLSLDITVPSDKPFWSRCYDRQQLGAIADYVMLMTYDEHWRTSSVSGSVASLPWVRRSLEKTLQQIPPSKLLLGLPFYTREWEESNKDGLITVQAHTLSMADTQNHIRDYNSAVLWLSDKGQNYTEYYRDGNRCRIWVEDAQSLALKAGLAYNYKLAGVAAWRLGFESKDIWPVLIDTLQEE